MELLFHIGMIFTIMAVSLTGMGRSSSYILEFDGDQSEFVDALDHIEPVKGEEEQPDRFLVDPLNFDALHFGPIRPRGPKGGSKFPWSPRSQFKMPQQSPIDICTCNCKPIAYNSPPLTLTYAKTERKEGIMIEMSNSGHGVTLKVPRFEARPTLSGGMLPNTYHFDNLHCHWGKDDAMGSEHYINGEAYAMECHLVTYNSKYQDINDALNNCVQKDQDSVCVYTTMFKLATEDNRKLKPMLDNIPRIRQNGSSILVANQEILSFIWEQASLPNKKEYIAYPGSLTTPPHTPCVNFLIEQTPTHISSKQLSVLRTMMDNHTPSKPVLTNRREIQTLNRRPIYCVKPPIKTSVKQIGPETSNDFYGKLWIL